MLFNPIHASKEIREYYLRYIETAFFIKDKDYFDMFCEKLRNESYFSKGPYLDATDSFKAGKSLEELIAEREISPLFRTLHTSMTRPLYAHQERAIRLMNRGENAVITTGTGSGKTESFLYPILNALFRQQEQGCLHAGVRALLIYPMNALANDQMKRLRELLKDTQITFGAYTGETEQTEGKAHTQYIKLNHCEPLENERISRDAIKESPPHLLITNYAMLEYLMIRPKDNTLFSGVYGENWQFIVLDEAHTYTGATGIEVAMLLKRLKARLSPSAPVQYILTSATLGSSEKDNGNVIHFANTLCSVQNFSDRNIIRAERTSVRKPADTRQYPVSMYQTLTEACDGANRTFFQKAHSYEPELLCGADIAETAFHLLVQDERYYALRELLSQETLSIADIMEKLDLSAEELVALIAVASKARKNGVSLLDARYHYFIRTLEGAYLTLPPYKKLFIEPRKTDGEQKVFKFSVCRSCGEIYIEGYTTKCQDDHRTCFSSDLEEASDSTERLHLEYYLLDGQKYDDHAEDSFLLCGKCGTIARKQDVRLHDKMCGCGSKWHHTVVRVPKEYLQTANKKSSVKHCIACEAIGRNHSVLRDFYIGQAAAASVIATALYGQIPSRKMIVHEAPAVQDDADDFGFAALSHTTQQQTEIQKLTKQYLIFSDSRQEAAYFASYFDLTYHNLLRRRILVEVLREHAEDYQGGVLPSMLCKHLTAAFSRYEIFSANNRKEEALKTILGEMVTSDRNGLEGLGILSFRYHKTLPELKIFQHQETNPVINVLLHGFRKKAALRYEDIAALEDEDKLFFQYSPSVQTMAFSKENQEKSSANRDTWTSSKRKNSRADYLMRLSSKIQGASWELEKVNRFLQNVWKLLLDHNSIRSDDNIGYRMLLDAFIIDSSFSEKLPLFRCSHCGKITAHNADSICPAFRCDGVLQPFHAEEIRRNHYYQIYTELDISDLIVKEHTAQLNLETAKKYQEAFVNKQINVLSCSTTFEMGVDVGDLETVFMKNMPPTPANYIQRAGRAGRRTDSAAYALTFCRLSSHDLNFYRTPERMIRGHIAPPYFEVSNEKIVRRHIHACCFSAFFRMHPESFSTVDVFFLQEYYEAFRRFITERSSSLMTNLYASVPQPLHGKIPEWLEQLTSPDGELHQVYQQISEEIQELEALRTTLQTSTESRDLSYALRINNIIRTIKDKDILSFLSQKSILPKYGFPVDSVELKTNYSAYDRNNASSLRLDRDLSIAIAEYAPDSEIIADGKVYTSRYVKLPPNRNHELISYWYASCENPECGCISVGLAPNRKMDTCRVCGSDVTEKSLFTIPVYGFIADARPKPASTRRPERTYRGDVHYVGAGTGQTESYRFGQAEVTVTRTTDDELLILNTAPFYVCPDCGYAFRKKSGMKEATLKTDKQHPKPTGAKCHSDFFRFTHFGHKFKTDVTILNISLPFEKHQALSVLYALLEGVSVYYGIERRDISGCLHTSFSGSQLHTIFVLYDTVPGGAGHVSRIAADGKQALSGIFQEACKIVSECTCGGEDGNGACYSCLCNYENQKYHDQLNRGLAGKYLRKLLETKSI